MAGNNLTLTFAGDSKQLDKAFDKVVAGAMKVGSAVGDTEDAFDTAVRGSGRFAAGLDKLDGLSMRLADGADGVSMALTATADAMAYADTRADRLERAQLDVQQSALDVEQAMLDMTQSIRDAAQAEIDTEQAALDLEQALLDQAVAQEEYNDAVAEHGASSLEAQQAKLDLAQADIDAKQAAEDSLQAEEDLAQARLDGKQASLDQADANLRLSETQRDLERQSSTMQMITDYAGMLTGILGGLAGIIGVVTAVQWAWNIAMTANPIGLIVAGIVLLVGAIVLIATKTTWFQDMWSWVWDKIGGSVKAVFGWIADNWKLLLGILTGPIGWAVLLITKHWDSIKSGGAALVDWFRSVPGRIRDAFSRLGGYISAPFRAGFNAVSRAWNATVGRLSWTVPGWVPGVGGNSISAPRLPIYHTGGIVPGSFGQETMAVLRAGERVTGGSNRADVPTIVIRGDGTLPARMALDMLRQAIADAGGDPIRVLAVPR